MVEEWRFIDGTGGDYEISNLGRVRKLGEIRDAVFVVHVNGKLRKIPHLVLEAFVGPRPAGMFCCHEDDNPKNNVLSNLRWGTPSENTQDAIRNGNKFLENVKTRGPGEQNGAAKLSNEDASEIRRLRQNNRKLWTVRALASKFGIGSSTVQHVLKGHTYK